MLFATGLNGQAHLVYSLSLVVGTRGEEVEKVVELLAVVAYGDSHFLWLIHDSVAHAFHVVDYQLATGMIGDRCHLASAEYHLEIFLVVANHVVPSAPRENGVGIETVGAVVERHVVEVQADAVRIEGLIVVGCLAYLECGASHRGILIGKPIVEIASQTSTVAI